MVLFDAPERFSFAYGVLTLRVVVSRGLLASVSAEELRAILEHERYHVCNLDLTGAIPFACAGLAAYWLIARRASRPLTTKALR